MIMACACATAHFDHDNKCLGEAFMTAPNGGSIIYFGSTRYDLPQAYYFYQDFFGKANHCAGIAWQMAKNKELDMWGPSEDDNWRFHYLQAIMFGDPELEINLSDITGIEEKATPEIASLVCFPNPFNTSTTIRFSIPVRGNVRVEVYNLLGRKVVDLMENRVLPSGNHMLYWNAKDHSRRTLPSGIYSIFLITNKHRITRKVILIK